MEGGVAGEIVNMGLHPRTGGAEMEETESPECRLLEGLGSSS